MNAYLSFVRHAFKSQAAAALLLMLSACGSTFDGLQVQSPAVADTSEESRKVVDNYSITVNWGTSDVVRSGVGAGTTISMTDLQEESSERDPNFPTCFENSRDCRRAAGDIQTEVFNNPVVVQGFQLNMTAQNYSGVGGASWSTVALDSASVTTAELRFRGNSGEMALGTAYTKQLVAGKTCSLSSANAVGYSSTDKILVGMRTADEATRSPTDVTRYYNAHLSAGRVWHSGIFPDGSNTAYPLGFRFVPQDDSLTNDFGARPYTESSPGTLVTPRFGVDANDPVSNYKSHVIVGFCIEGRKTGSYSRPLLYYMDAYVRRPKLEKLKE